MLATPTGQPTKLLEKLLPRFVLFLRIDIFVKQLTRQEEEREERRGNGQEQGNVCAVQHGEAGREVVRRERERGEKELWCLGV